MPELPEAEIARRHLESWLAGKKLTVRVHDPRVVRGDAAAYVAALAGRRVARVGRHGKHILADLDQGALWLHLGMSGKVLRRGAKDELPKATRVEFAFRGGRVCFVDTRVFGRTAAGARGEVLAVSHMDALGVDALAIQSGAELAAAMGRTRLALKVALMDQGRVAGLGNIQAAEALFRAGIDPAKSPADLDEAGWATLYDGIRATLEHTLQASSAEEVAYMSDGAHVVNPFLVYGREGEPCERCEGTIARFTQSGRSTFWCPDCQK